jgi:Flp pilus assembly protein TadG
MFDLLHSFARDTRGNVALIFGLALLPIVGAVGAAVDYSNANKVRSWLTAAADSASVSSIAKASPAMAAAAKMNHDGKVSAGAKDAVAIFNAEIQGKTGFKLKSVTATVMKTQSTVTSTVDFKADVPTYFMGIFGHKSVSVSGKSAAANGLPTFIDFTLLLDNSPSMGVAATPADIDTMVKNTPDKCAFACHDLSTPNNYYQLAKNLNVTTRIDVLRTATQSLMDTAQATETVTDQFRMAIYTFGASASALGLNTITTLTSNLANAKTAASKIDLMTVPYQGYNNDQATDYADVMGDVNNAISAPGTGVSSASPQKVLFFVSDGVGDANVGGKRTIAPIDQSLCKRIKDRGIKIAVLYTTYLPLPTNAFYNTYVKPFTSDIGPTMQACASPGLYFEVSPTQGISEAMNALFQRTLAQAHLIH